MNHRARVGVAAFEALSNGRSSPKIRNRSAPAECCSKPASTMPQTSGIRCRAWKEISGGCRRSASASASARSPSFRSTAASTITWASQPRRRCAAGGAAHGGRGQHARRRGHRHRHEDPAAGGGAEAPLVRVQVRDQASERGEREGAGPRHHRFLRIAARRQDRAVDSRRRQPRRRDSGEPRRATGRTTC